MKARPAVLALALLAIVAIAPPAHAQDEPMGSIRLVSQSSWTTPNDPVLRVRVLVRNEGSTTIEAPEVGWTLGSKIAAREQYEAALVEGPAVGEAGDTMHLDTPLEPDRPQEVGFEIDTGLYSAIDEGESGVYPLKLELRSAGVVLAAVTTAAIHIVQTPDKPVAFSWWTEIDSPVAFAPDGSLFDTTFEATLEAGGGVVEQVAAIAEVVESLERQAEPRSPGTIDLVVSPSTLDQLDQAADGFRRADGTTVGDDERPAVVAAETLARLRSIAASPIVRLHATPFASPRLPSLLASAVLRDHLEAQWRLGDATFERLLGEPPDDRVARPPGLALDESSVDELVDRGATTILGAMDSVPRPTNPLDLAPPPAASITTALGNQVEIILPDPATQTLLLDEDLRADPVRAAQVVLGELATIWRELPVPPDPQVRGIAVDLPSDLPSEMWRPLLRRLTSAPFLSPVYAEDLPTKIDPAPDDGVLDGRRGPRFSSAYVSDLFTTARDVSAFASMVLEPEGAADRLERALLYAESSQYLGDEKSGRRWIDSVNFVTDPTFEELAPDTSRVLTFTSRTGRIPLRMGDPGDRVVRVKIVLRSGRVDFLDTGSRTVRLDQANQVVTFDAEVKAAGPSRIDVLMYSPSGVELSHSILVVSSTALNPIALIITAGAGLVLVGLWSRRLFRRRSR